MGGKGLTGPICPYMYLLLNSFPPRLAKTVLIVFLLCVTPDNFTHQGRASGWERVKQLGYSASLHKKPRIAPLLMRSQRVMHQFKAN